MNNFTLQNHGKKDNQYDVSQIGTLTMINKSLTKFNLKIYKS